jgi:uncharacterized protein YbbC (DUF1343 family)
MPRNASLTVSVPIGIDPSQIIAAPASADGRFIGIVRRPQWRERLMAGSPLITAGIDRIAGHAALFEGRRLGLVANRSSCDGDLIPTWRRLAGLRSARIVRLFAPEHGVSGSAPAGEGLTDGIDGASGLPVVALYGPRRRPEPKHLADLDAVVFDLADAGCRAFTYLSTLVELCAATAEAGVPLIVLDRPNPAGGRIEGGGVAAGAENFVAAYDLPLRHGLTLGEAARLYCAEQGLPLPSVVPCAGWAREPAEPGRVWIAPSPNLPSPASVLAYCGTVLVEGTALSEGRGTTRPFTTIGAPGLEADALAEHLRQRGLPGLLVRPLAFRPAQSKHAGEPCDGIEFHIHDPAGFLALPVILEIFAFLRDRQPALLAPSKFLDRLSGGPRLRAWCQTPDAAPDELLEDWSTAHERYRERIAPHLLYPGSK